MGRGGQKGAPASTATAREPRHSNVSDEDNPADEEEGAGLSAGGIIDLTFIVFPSLAASEAKAAEVEALQAKGGYVPWELTAAPWQRLGKWMHKKYLVGMVVRAEPAVLVIQTNHAPEHPNRAALRSKTLLGWVAKELDIAGEVRQVLRARVEGIGLTMEEQVAVAQEAQAREAVQAFLVAMGEGEPSTCEAVIACLQAMELDPPDWLPHLEELGEEAGEEDEEGEEGSGSRLVEFIEGVKAAVGNAAEAEGEEDEEEAAEEEEEAVELEAVADITEAKKEEEAGEGENEDEDEDEKAAIAARMIEEGRGMGMASRDELQGLLQRVAECDGAMQCVDGKFVEAGETRWEDWEQQILAPPKARIEQPDADEKPPPGLTPKELKKWQKRQEQASQGPAAKAEGKAANGNGGRKR